VKIGFISLPVVGHLNPMAALARRLQSRGHEVVFIGVPDVEPFARAAGLTFMAYCENEYPAGSIARLFAPVSRLHGLDVARWSVRERLCYLFSAGAKHMPRKIAQTDVEALVIDTIHTFLEVVPMSLGMPYVHVWNVLHSDISGTTPPCFFSWPHENTPEARARNRDGVKTVGDTTACMLDWTLPGGQDHYFKAISDLAVSDGFTGENAMEISKKFDTNFPGAH
jgi:zeaxanthin glucosyltransferase